MSLSEYKSPVVKKPKFGWQRYQFGNKSAAELKLSLWDANLSEVSLPNASSNPTFPITSTIELSLYHDSDLNLGKTQHDVIVKLLTPINNINELVQFLNKRFPFFGEFRPQTNQLNIQLVVDSTWARLTQDDETGTWTLTVNCN